MHVTQDVAVKDVRFSKTNPRAGINQERLKELAESIRNVGVLEPILVRPLEEKNGVSYELVCGERRLRAAQLAELGEIPAIVRDLTDQQALEVQVIENLQREDLHPLDEAAGYQRLMRTAKYDVAKIAARIGRSVKYVYDRVKLLQLTEKATELFLANRITAGHAILLARLKPKDQARALEDVNGGVFEHEDTLFDPEDRYRREDSLKPRSVRELQGWIDEHVKFDVESPDLPDLFPETAAALAIAGEDKRKVIQITHENIIRPEARGEGRIYGPRSWKRADGEEVRDDVGRRKVKSKTCDRSGLGVIMTGPGRGESFTVCVSRSCEVHWPEQAKKTKHKAAGKAEGGWRKEQEERQRQRAESQRRWEKALPAVLKAVEAAIAKAPTGADGPVAAIVGRTLGGYGSFIKPQGRTAEEVLRNFAYALVARGARDTYSGHERGPKDAKAFGVDVAKILKAEAPPAPKGEKKPAKGKAKRKRGAK